MTYSNSDLISFSSALHMLKQAITVNHHAYIKRIGWDSDKYLILDKGVTDFSAFHPNEENIVAFSICQINGIDADLFLDRKEEYKSPTFYLVEGSTQTEWTPTSEDILANDWKYIK